DLQQSLNGRGQKLGSRTRRVARPCLQVKLRRPFIERADDQLARAGEQALGEEALSQHSCKAATLKLRYSQGGPGIRRLARNGQGQHLPVWQPVRLLEVIELAGVPVQQAAIERPHPQAALVSGERCDIKPRKRWMKRSHPLAVVNQQALLFG